MGTRVTALVGPVSIQKFRDAIADIDPEILKMLDGGAVLEVDRCPDDGSFNIAIKYEAPPES